MNCSHRNSNNQYSTYKIAGAVSGLAQIGWAVTATRNGDGKEEPEDCLILLRPAFLEPSDKRMGTPRSHAL